MKTTSTFINNQTINYLVQSVERQTAHDYKDDGTGMTPVCLCNT